MRDRAVLRDKAGPRGAVVGIEESPEMAAVALEQITREGWRNVTVVQSPAEDAAVGVTAGAALFCAVHDIFQSPGALANVLARLRLGAWVAAGGGKWASPLLVGVNLLVGLLHVPYVRSFRGFSRPWSHLEPLVEDVQVHEVAWGGGYIMTGRTPARPGRSGSHLLAEAACRPIDPKAQTPVRWRDYVAREPA
jgi:hypothetical protein